MGGTASSNILNSKKFSKVSPLLTSPQKLTVALTFENFYQAQELEPCDTGWYKFSKSIVFLYVLDCTQPFVFLYVLDCRMATIYNCKMATILQNGYDVAICIRLQNGYNQLKNGYNVAICTTLQPFYNGYIVHCILQIVFHSVDCRMACRMARMYSHSTMPTMYNAILQIVEWLSTSLLPVDIPKRSIAVNR